MDRQDFDEKEFESYCRELGMIPDIRDMKQGNDEQIYRLAVLAAILYLIYGAYVVLFGICIRILLKRRHGRYRLHCLSITTLFVLGTMATIVGTIIEVESVTAALKSILDIVAPPWLCSEVLPKSERYETENFSWGFIATNKMMVFRLALLVVSKFVQVQFHLCVSLTTTFRLEAGRIIYISREATKYVGKGHRNMYKTVVAITLESGLIYPTTLIIYIAFTLAESELNHLFHFPISPRMATYSIFSTVAQYTLHQAAGIAPTLVIVRTSLGIAIEDTKSCITTFRAGQHDDTQVDIPQSQSAGGPVLDISRSNGPGY
ncbi:hypothetical protein VNI00_018790 [Paramarasmius palmivorus]|uniref:G protein-coupled receptor n=1 Tax=Paramarasmius palmivorus TaxID=297713 RepID=A0AAW0AV89_9AGAR